MNRRPSYRASRKPTQTTPFMAGAPARAGRGGIGSAAASGPSVAGMSLGTIGLFVIAFVIGATALIGMAVTAHLLSENVKRLDKRIGSDRDLIAALNSTILDQKVIIGTIEDDVDIIEADLDLIQNDITIINETMPEGNGTVFFDDEWVMAYSADHSRQFMFDASQITTTHPADRRTYIAPDANGTLALLSDIPPPTTTFAESAFAVYVDGDPTTELQFDLTLFTAGTDRVAQWPNKSGTVAYLADIIAFGGNSTNFLDSAFSIRNDPDTSKVAVFSAALLTSGEQREYAFPDKNGTLALLSDVNTMGGGTVFLDVDFAIWNDADNTKVMTFNASLISSNTTQEYWFPNLSGEVVLTEGIQTVDDKTLEMTNTYNIDLHKHTFYGDGNASMAIDSTLPWSDHENVTLGMPGFAIATGNWGLPVTNLAVGTAAFDDVEFAIYSGGSTDSQIRFDLAHLGNTTTSTLKAPLNSGTLLVAQGGTDGVAVREAVFDLSLFTAGSEHIYNLPDKNGTVALLSDIGGATSTYGFRQVKAGNLTLVNDTTTTVTGWDTNTDSFNYDNSMGDFNATTGVFTVGTGEDGFYSVSASIEVAVGAGSHPSLHIAVNPNSISSVDVVFQQRSATMDGPTQVYASTMLKLYAGNTVEVRATQYSGGLLDLLDGRITHFSCHRIA